MDQLGKRATGLDERLTKYSWSKQPNGKYTIYNVEVFKLHSGLQNSEGKWLKRPVTEEDGKKIISNFRYETESLSKFPRVHLEHHNFNSTSSRPGAGYFDNLRLKNGVFYADLVEISPEAFTDISDLKFPYRSAEYDPRDKKIISLALMESMEPTFPFPMLKPEETETYMSIGQVEHYSRRLTQIYKGDNVEDPDKKEEDNPVQNTQGSGMEEIVSKYLDENMPGLIEKHMGEKIPEYLSRYMDEQLPGMIEKHMGISATKDSEDEENSTVKVDSEEPNVISHNKNPLRIDKKGGSVPNQNFVSVETYKKDIEKMRKEILSDLKEESEKASRAEFYSRKLQDICYATGQDFELFNKSLQSCTNDEARDNIIALAENGSSIRGHHPANEIIEHFTKTSPNEIYAKYSSGQQKLVRNLEKDYREGISYYAKGGKAERFQKVHGTMEEFIDRWVFQEENDPGSYSRYRNGEE